MSLQRLREADSTNDVLKRALAGADGALPADGDAVYTDSQTAGRGRRGRAWENRPGEALYYSRLVRRPLADAVTLPLLCSLAAADAVRALCGQEAGVKWPNDLLLGGKKICGILCESVTAAGQTSYILGIGINLLQPEEFFAARGLVHGGSLLSQTGCRSTVAAAAAALDAALARRLPAFADAGFAAIAGEYRRVCVNLGREVFAGEVRGTAAAIDDAGRLVVRTPAGTTTVFTGEVTVHGIY